MEDIFNTIICLKDEFDEATHTDWDLPQDVMSTLTSILCQLGQSSLRSSEERKKEIEAAISSKLKLNHSTYKKILDVAAEHNIILNFHEKAIILSSLDYSDRTQFFGLLLRKELTPDLWDKIADSFKPAGRADTFQALSYAASDKQDFLPILRAVFAAYIFHSFDRKKILGYFAGTGDLEEQSSFYGYLKKQIPAVFSRSCGLILWKIDDGWLMDCRSREEIQTKILSHLEYLASQLSNHCSLAVLIKPLKQGEGLKWQIYSDLILYGEKHQATPLKVGYFHPQKIANQTKSYIPNLDLVECQFEVAHEGLYFKDCFIINYRQEATSNAPQHSNASQEPDLLLLFEKNERDETLIPCPACRSTNVQGNSYPVLGVRSWECKNCICPERSRSDRGNRYSLASLLRQEAIEEVEATIPISSLRQWKRDIVRLTSENDILTMLIRHYSLINDKVVLLNFPITEPKLLGRRLSVQKTLAAHQQKDEVVSKAKGFFDGPYFNRICVPRSKLQNVSFTGMSKIESAQVYCADCFDVLQQIEDNTVDGIVTSPPYYNARDYAIWPNIYCFLYDQLNVANELHRVLKPGGLFLYNIFDYFDNENNIVFSAMGNKRMILGAYAINLFERAGFHLVKNVVWDKGEIEGKRNFNQGNRSPYYQSPFNCWEHILVFQKPPLQASWQRLPYVLRAQPVVKMIGGRNILGHTAPYPEAIPNLLLELLEPHSTVLDPYSGSMTTARAAAKYRMRSISIDYKEDYCRLGINLLMNQETQRSQGELF